MKVGADMDLALWKHWNIACHQRKHERRDVAGCESEVPDWRPSVVLSGDGDDPTAGSPPDGPQCTLLFLSGWDPPRELSCAGLDGLMVV